MDEPTWKYLKKYLNKKQEHNERDILTRYYGAIYYKYYDSPYKESNLEILKYIELLRELKFVERWQIKNQNGTHIKKIKLKRKIPKKLTLTLAQELRKGGWLSWFMFPERF